MKCPFCNGEMEDGFLQGMRRVAWVKKKHKITLLPKEEEILLENNVVADFLISASICKYCKKIMVDYSQKEIQEA